VPADTPTVSVPADVMQDGRAMTLKLIVACGFAATNSEARRLIDEKGIRLNGEVVEGATGTLAVKNGDILQRGKRRFARLNVS